YNFRLLDGSFHDNYIPTIEKFYRKVFRIKGQFYQMDILDTGGRQPFPATRRLACLTGDLFLIVFSLDDEESWKQANIDMQKIERIIDQFSYCVCVETSAKKNINISKLYFKLFFLANVPLEMTPDLHHTIPPENI
ncbi:GTP-binding protein Rhes, partial [Armadillidium nasatum]